MPIARPPQEIRRIIDQTGIDTDPCTFIVREYPEKIRDLWNMSLQGAQFNEHAIAFYQDPDDGSWATSEVTKGTPYTGFAPSDIPDEAINLLVLHTHPAEGDPFAVTENLQEMLSALDFGAVSLVPDYVDSYPRPMKAFGVVTRKHEDVDDGLLRVHVFARNATGDVMAVRDARRFLERRDSIFQAYSTGNLGEEVARRELAKVWSGRYFNECQQTFSL